MKIVTTPMCQEILRLAGVSEFQLINDGVYGDADVAIILSETKINENSHTKFIKLKLNTFKQIEDSIKLISNILGTKPLKVNLIKKLVSSRKDKNKEIKIKAYSNFSSEIAEDMGFNIVVGATYDFLIYPDYLRKELKKELYEAGGRAIELPSHGNAPSNPIKRAEMRYKILEKSICMKH